MSNETTSVDKLAQRVADTIYRLQSIRELAIGAETDHVSLATAVAAIASMVEVSGCTLEDVHRHLGGGGCGMFPSKDPE